MEIMMILLKWRSYSMPRLPVQMEISQSLEVLKFDRTTLHSQNWTHNSMY